MSVERRGQVIRVMTQLVNWQQEEPTDRGEERQLFMNDTSRVSREAPARFREGRGVKLPRGYSTVQVVRKQCGVSEDLPCIAAKQRLFHVPGRQ